MSIGRTFKESLQKRVPVAGDGAAAVWWGWQRPIRGDEGGWQLGHGAVGAEAVDPWTRSVFSTFMRRLQAGMAVEQIFELTAIDPWYLRAVASRS